MSMLIVLDNDYNNESVNYKVLEYVITSDYTFEYDGKGIPISSDMTKRDIMESAMHMSIPQKAYGIVENDKKLVHMVLAFHDLNGTGLYEEPLIESSLKYFYTRGFQCVAAFHYKSGNREYYEHIHLVVNKINLNLKKFNESNQTYYDFANYLCGITKSNWEILRKPSYWNESLFEEDIW